MNTPVQPTSSLTKPHAQFSPANQALAEQWIHAPQKMIESAAEQQK
ncbi:MAG TPA: hypothetical protein VKM56_04980 [Verrucomicrobiae bacterium]|nr:hypothetical protein [Verrucomicrobiae bacterium]